MCGICGTALRDPAGVISEREIAAMAATLVHRGPDSSGSFFGRAVGLGARRLSIIDLEHGDQPMQNESGTLTVVFNGEIYNHAALRRELVALGHTFRTASDTEVVVHAFEQWGKESLQRFRGMFALALWDAASETLTLAVDRFGIKPLYVAHSDEAIAFGSEPAAIFASDRVSRRVEERGLAAYLALGYVPPPGSIFGGVEKLPPATVLRWSRRRAVLDRTTYWQAPAEVATTPEEELRHDVRAALGEAVASHLVSDVPVGLLLSGGIDSTLVLALMSRLVDAPVQTFSVGFGERGIDELAPASRVAARFGADHHELLLGPEAALDLPAIVRSAQEPFADPAALPTYAVSRLASRHVKVALSGDGGDELFVGYTTFRGVEASRHAQRVPAPLRRALAARRPLPSRPRSVAAAAQRWDTRLRDTAADPPDAYRRKIALLAPGRGAELLAPGLRAHLSSLDPFAGIDGAFRTAGRSVLQSAVDASRSAGLPGNMLVKVDRMSMAHSLELRVPLLDHRLADLILRTPAEALAPRLRLKGLLKDAAADLLPADVLRRRKHGFDVPLGSWFRGDLGRFAADVLLDGPTRARGLVDDRQVEAALRRLRAGAPGLARPIWGLLALELWFRECL